ncbi:MAG: OsmC family protein [Planctomycetota bacterium]
MDQDSLRAIQAPLKERYRTNPETARAEMRVTGSVTFEPPGCRMELPPNDGRQIRSGLHPCAGGDGTLACAGDMLLQSLVACAGTTLAAVSIAMGLSVTAATIRATGVMDFRGTLGVDRAVPVGMSNISMEIELAGTLSGEQADKLVQLMERYCVVYQTLRASVDLSTSHAVTAVNP